MATLIDTIGASGRGNKPPSKLSVEIEIDDHFTSKIYTSGSTVIGRAKVESPTDVAFRSVEVTINGVANTWSDLNQRFWITNRRRPFIKLLMPMTDGCLPQDHILKAGETYYVPFAFIIPFELTIGSCTHDSPSHVREQHMRLPPSMGCWAGEDDAPRWAAIEYSVKATVFPHSEDSLGKINHISGSHEIKVLPATSEDAPLDIDGQDEWYALERSITVRKGIFPGKSGKLHVSALQPSAVMLSPDGKEATSSSARLILEYLPSSSDIPPPKIGNVTGKLQSATFFSASPMNRVPSFGLRARVAKDSCQEHSNTVALFNISVGEVNWERTSSPSVSAQSPSPPQDEKNGFSYQNGNEEKAVSKDTNQNRRSGSSSSAPTLYRATLDIPFSIPVSNHKILLPSFHNCLISRVYILRLTLTAGPTNSTLSLAVPVQVGVSRGAEPRRDEDLPSFESVIGDDDVQQVDGFLGREGQSPTNENEDILPNYADLR